VLFSLFFWVESWLADWMHGWLDAWLWRHVSVSHVLGREGTKGRQWGDAKKHAPIKETHSRVRLDPFFCSSEPTTSRLYNILPLPPVIQIPPGYCPQVSPLIPPLSSSSLLSLLLSAKNPSQALSGSIVISKEERPLEKIFEAQIFRPS